MADNRDKCKVCGDETDVKFNIDFKAVPICEDCATAIFIQQANWYTKTIIKKDDDSLSKKTKKC